jgi:L,D-transpeptidase YcbB
MARRDALNDKAPARAARADALGSPMRTIVTLLGIILLIAFGAAAIRMYRVSRSIDHQVWAALQRQLKPGNLPAFVRSDEDRVEKDLRRFYRGRRGRRAWIEMGRPNGPARELVEVLGQADREGLRPASYRVDRIRERFEELAGGLNPLATPDPRELADLELLLSHSYLKYAGHVLHGRVRPRALPAGWHTRPRSADLPQTLERALRQDGIRGSLERLAPEHPQYQRLRIVLARYREIAAQGGWPRVPRGRTLKLGSRDPRVAALRRRLILSGDLSGNAAAGPYDRVVEKAVRSYQIRNGLEPTGRVGPDDVAMLDVPVEERVRQIELNLERWRWMPRSLGERHLLVNVPEFVLRLYEGERMRWAMRVVVGKEFTRTPIFSDTLTHVVFNPYWNVPETIAAEEIAVEAMRNPGFLASQNMRVFAGHGEDAREVDPYSVNWSAVAGDATGFPYSIRQDPGEHNALGHVKFLLPNRFNVYLHDTPMEHLFEKSERDFSHGCIRIEQPLLLAEYLLRGSDWSSARIAAAIDSSHERHVKVPRPIPVHILYWTVWVDDEGAAHFRDDLYGIDRMLDRMLDRREPASTADRRPEGRPRGS